VDFGGLDICFQSYFCTFSVFSVLALGAAARRFVLHGEKLFNICLLSTDIIISGYSNSNSRIEVAPSGE